MKNVSRLGKVRSLGLLALVTLAACTVTGEGYVGGYYEPPGYEYGAWQPHYYVAPPRGGEHRGDRDEHRPEPQKAPAPRAYRPAPPSRSAPSIPTRPAPPPGHDSGHR